jgi:hypothetical protein
VIRSRTRHDRLRAKRFRHEVIDFDAKPRASARLLAEVETSLLAEQADGQDDTGDLVATAVSELRALAAADRDVLLILDAYAQLATKRSEVMRATDLSSQRYENARKRLVRFVQQLSPDLHNAARACA